MRSMVRPMSAAAEDLGGISGGHRRLGDPDTEVMGAGCGKGSAPDVPA